MKNKTNKKKSTWSHWHLKCWIFNGKFKTILKKKILKMLSICNFIQVDLRNIFSFSFPSFLPSASASFFSILCMYIFAPQTNQFTWSNFDLFKYSNGFWEILIFTNFYASQIEMILHEWVVGTDCCFYCERENEIGK